MVSDLGELDESPVLQLPVVDGSVCAAESVVDQNRDKILMEPRNPQTTSVLDTISLISDMRNIESNIGVIY